MNEIKVFENPDFGKVRTVEINGEPWLVGKDVAEALGYQNPNDALANHVDDEDKNTIAYRDGNRGNPNMTVINESGFYSLVLSSKIPTAKQFKRWVTSEVLPSLRKNGSYIVGQENMSNRELIARAVIAAQQELEELTAQNQLMAPKAEYYDELVARNTLTNFRETAKELGVPERKLISLLKDNKYIYHDKKGRIQPYSSAVNDGLFTVKESYSEKTSWSGTQTLVTPKGRDTFRLLCKEFVLE